MAVVGSALYFLRLIDRIRERETENEVRYSQSW